MLFKREKKKTSKKTRKKRKEKAIRESNNFVDKAI